MILHVQKIAISGGGMRFYFWLFAIMVCVAVTAVEIPLINPEFNVVDGRIPGWQADVIKGTPGSVSSVVCDENSGRRAIRISSENAVDYFGIYQGGIDLKKFPRPAAGEELQITLKFRQKNENVSDGGFANVSFYSETGYLAGRDTPKRSGTFDWGEVETSVRFKEIPRGARFFYLRFYLGKTNGTVYFSEPRLFVNIVKKVK